MRDSPLVRTVFGLTFATGEPRQWRRWFCVGAAAAALAIVPVASASIASAQSDGGAAILPPTADRTLRPVLRPRIHSANSDVPDAPVSVLSHNPASLLLAYGALDKTIGEWDDQHACATCHHTHSGLVANAIAGRKGPFDGQVIRRLAEHIEHNYTPSVYDYQRPGYTNSEAVWSAVSLGLWGARNHSSAVSRSAVTACKTALSRLPAEHTDWPWLSFGMAPWEDDSSPASGLALLGVAIGLLDKDLTDSSAVADKAKLRSRLARQMGQTNSLHLDLLLLWASSGWDELAKSAPAGFRERVLQSVARGQRSDGGWSLVGLGSTSNTRCAASDGYSTGLAVLVLRFAGVPSTDAVLTKGTAWIRDNQLADGMWSTVSPTYNSSALGSREGDLTIMGSGFCAAALADAPERSGLRNKR